ncbi:MAG: pilus assembly protein [Pseudomonadota bacterium]
MFLLLKSFYASEDGAVTVDWVVLTAFLIGFALAVLGAISSGTEDLTGDVETQMRSEIIQTSFD